MNIPLSLRIENALGLEEGLLMTLQVHYDIVKEKHRLSQNKRPDISKIRPALFWDTTLEKVDFTAHKRYVINRVFERGTEEEIQEIIRFYGRETILSSIANAIDSPFTDNVKQNLKMYLNYEEKHFTISNCQTYTPFYFRAPDGIRGFCPISTCRWNFTIIAIWP